MAGDGVIMRADGGEERVVGGLIIKVVGEKNHILSIFPYFLSADYLDLNRPSLPLLRLCPSVAFYANNK